MALAFRATDRSARKQQATRRPVAFQLSRVGRKLGLRDQKEQQRGAQFVLARASVICKPRNSIDCRPELCCVAKSTQAVFCALVHGAESSELWRMRSLGGKLEACQKGII